MVRPTQGADWEDWKNLLKLQREIDPYRDEFGDPYTFDPYDFQQIDCACDLMRKGDLSKAATVLEIVRACGGRIRVADARLIQAEALVYLGDVYRQHGQQDLASQVYQEAIVSFEMLQTQHNLGVALFRFATLCEEMGQLEKARECYCRVRTIWLGLERENGRRGNWKRLQRYSEQRGKIEEQIKEVVRLIPTIAPFPQVIQVLPVRFEIAAIPIYETRLAAGAGVWVAGDAVVDYVNFDSILIRNVRYTLTNLVDRNQAHYVRLQREYEHAAVQVIGNSMDQAGIENLDYVILRKPRGSRYTPENMHIVAAIIPDMADRRGILKRFQVEHGFMLLKSETSEPDLPEHQTRKYPLPRANQEPPVEFIGQAIAVLKPM